MSRVFGRPISPFVALAALLALAVVGLVLLFGSPSGNVGASEDPIAAASRERVRAALLDGCQGRATPFAPLACRFLKGGCANSIDQCACFSAMTASRFGEAEA